MRSLSRGEFSPAGFAAGPKSPTDSEGVANECFLALRLWGTNFRTSPRKNSLEESDSFPWSVFFRRRKGVSALRFRVWLGDLPTEQGSNEPHALVSFGSSVIPGFKDVKLKDIVFDKNDSFIFYVRANSSKIRAGFE